MRDVDADIEPLTEQRLLERIEVGSVRRAHDTGDRRDLRQLIKDLRVTDVGIKSNLVRAFEEFTVGEGDDAGPKYKIDQGRFVASTDPKYKFRGSLTVTLTRHPSNQKSAARRR